MPESYLEWVTKHTRTKWWNDSIDPKELGLAIERGSVGATSNPFLANIAILNNIRQWSDEIRPILGIKELEQKAEALYSVAVKHAASQLINIHKSTNGEMGYVCAQVNPDRAEDREYMLAMAKRFSQWAPNVSVKLPGTAAGIDVMEECTLLGISTTVTISYTVPQVIAIAESYRRGRKRTENPGKCFSVIMIGRLDDYIQAVARSSNADIKQEDIPWAGLAVTKRAYEIYQRERYEANLLVAAYRGTYHLTEIAGADLVVSLTPEPWQTRFVSERLPHEERIGNEVPKEAIDRLMKLSEFRKAYEPGGMTKNDFYSFALCHMTLKDFYWNGWKLLENFKNI